MAHATDDSLDGAMLERMFIAAKGSIERHRDSIDRLNVFPVPDGDTGTNLHTTLEAAVAAIDDTPADSMKATTAAAARGALYGASGNAGVLLAQFLLGLSEGMADLGRLTANGIASALCSAYSYVYSCLTHPVEGTILTLVRDIASAASRYEGNDVRGLFRLISETAENTVKTTPTLLDALKKANVVDAGAYGFSLMLHAMYDCVAGDAITRPEITDSADDSRGAEAGNVAAAGSAAAAEAEASEEHAAFSAVSADPAHAAVGSHRRRHETYGYCTEFLLAGPELDAAAVRSALEDHGESLIVAGGGRHIRVHMHAADPGSVLSAALRFGSLGDISIRNMDEQYEAFVGHTTTDMRPDQDAGGPGETQGDQDTVRVDEMRRPGESAGAAHTPITGRGRQNIGIVTDSVCDLPEEVVKELGIAVVPLTLRFGNEELRDGIDISADEFYARLDTDSHFPKTSVPPPMRFAEAYDALADGTDTILAITVSSKLSGTFEVASRAVNLMRRRGAKPSRGLERTGGGGEPGAAAGVNCAGGEYGGGEYGGGEYGGDCRVQVLDSGWAAMGQGFIVMKAAEAALRGGTLEEVRRAASDASERVDFLATFDTLEYLRRGGRIGRAKALFGNVLKLHPLITLKDGMVTRAGAALSRRNAIRRLVEFTKSHTGIERICVSHASCAGDAERLTKNISDLFPGVSLYTSRLTPVMGAHTGPGLLMVTILAEKPHI